MKVITAPKKYEIKPTDVTVYLAGGIGRIEYDWRTAVIRELTKCGETKNLVVFNPYNKDFKETKDPGTFHKRVEWEYDHLNKVNIFSVLLCNNLSDQPISLYELGRYGMQIQNQYEDTEDKDNFNRKIIISIEDGYKKLKDVVVQTDLAYDGTVDKKNNNLIDMIIEPNNENDHDKLYRLHASRIYYAYQKIQEQNHL